MKPEEILERLSERYGDDWPEEALTLMMRMGGQGVIRGVPVYEFLYHWVVDTLKVGIAAKLEVKR